MILLAPIAIPCVLIYTFSRQYHNWNVMRIVKEKRASPDIMFEKDTGEYYLYDGNSKTGKIPLYLHGDIMGKRTNG